MFWRGLNSQFKDTEESNWLSMLVATTISSEGVGGELTIKMLTYLEQHSKKSSLHDSVRLSQNVQLEV